MTIAYMYKTCKWVLDGLTFVPGFDHLNIIEDSNDEDDLSLSLSALSSSNSSNAHQQKASKSNNRSHMPAPLYRLWQLCRQGHILCSLFNLLKPEAAIDLTFEQNSCKKQHQVFVYRFIIACRHHLTLNEDDLFTVSEMYQDNAIGFSKVIQEKAKL